MAYLICTDILRKLAFASIGVFCSLGIFLACLPAFDQIDVT